MTPADLAELKALEAKATAAPWDVERRFSNGCEIVPRIRCERSKDRECGWIADLIGAPYLGYESTLANAELVAKLRNAAKELIEAADSEWKWKAAAEEEARAGDEARAELDTEKCVNKVLESSCDSRIEEVARLRSLLVMAAEALEPFETEYLVDGCDVTKACRQAAAVLAEVKKELGDVDSDASGND